LALVAERFEFSIELAGIEERAGVKAVESGSHLDCSTATAIRFEIALIGEAG
jgi:hypothetical protein